MLEYESMGDLCEKSGNKEAVIENYQLALKLATTLYYYGQVLLLSRWDICHRNLTFGSEGRGLMYHLSIIGNSNRKNISEPAYFHIFTVAFDWLF